MTGERTFQSTSEIVGKYFLNQLPADFVPPWDFGATGDAVPKDSSASAVASYGFLKLYSLTAKRAHLESATHLLRALADTCANGSDAGGLLLHATADLPHGLGIDGSTMYGDYYYLKSLVALRDLSRT
jgi:unsaturated chondroitin disaccharide hydrolase